MQKYNQKSNLNNQPEFLAFGSNQTLQPRIKQQVFSCISIPLDAPIEHDITYYRDAIEAIKDAQEGDVVELVINTPGGSLQTALAFISAIEETAADVVAIIEGEASSAGSLIALSCPNIQLNRYSTMFIHSSSFGSVGKSSEIKSHVEFNLAWVEEIIRETYKYFLTDQEIQQVLDGRDIYLDVSNIEQRLERKNELLQKEYKKQQQEAKKLANTATEGKSSCCSSGCSKDKPKKKPKVLDVPITAEELGVVTAQ